MRMNRIATDENSILDLFVGGLFIYYAQVKVSYGNM